MSKKKSKKVKVIPYKKADLKADILKVFFSNPSKLFNYKQISGNLNVKDSGIKQLITKLLIELEQQGKLKEISNGRYKLKSHGAYIVGKINISSKGSAVLDTDESEELVHISQLNLRHALNGDLVRVYIYARRKHQPLEGEVIEIIQRAQSTFVGVLQVGKNFAFLIPADRSFTNDIFIPIDKTTKGLDGYKVIVEITDWPKRAKNPIGKIVEVLGEEGDNEAEMHAILAEFNLPYKFPESILKDAENIDESISKEEIKKRKDFRKTTTFTIDPLDAKDFDDALSLKKLDNGNYEIGIHIADVSHYVQPDTALNNEAVTRATSVYLVDRVVPMLPEKLSNKVCSLRPNEEKLCFSAVFEINKEAEIKKQWFGRTVINSDKRFTYEEAQEVLETGKGTFVEELNILDDIAKKFREQRFKDGAISFERTEVKFDIDDKGKPLGIYFKETKDSNHLIEEFMLLANKKVAEYIGKKEKDKTAKTFVYRIHDKPNQEKLINFAKFAKKLGYKINTNVPSKISSSLNQVLKDVVGKGEQNMIETLAVRTMAKAEYSTQNIGHYGLSFKHYTHFTSPIRRFPDVMVHRLLQMYLDGEKSQASEKYEQLCKHSSDMEHLASKAERSSIKYKQVEFMQDKIGEVFTGVISGVAEWGVYVEIEDNKCEGLVPLRDMLDDFYVFDQENYRIIGKRNRKTYQLGDKLNIEIVRTNLQKKQMDFRIIGRPS